MPRRILSLFLTAVAAAAVAAQSADPKILELQRLKRLNRLVNPDAARGVVSIGQPVPDFTLKDQEGSPVALSSLRGKVVALTFGYVRCPNPAYCFRLASNLGQLQSRLKSHAGRDLVLLSVMLDPERDQGRALADYARIWTSQPWVWHFLTGSLLDVKRVAASFRRRILARRGQRCALPQHSRHRSRGAAGGQRGRQCPDPGSTGRTRLERADNALDSSFRIAYASSTVLEDMFLDDTHPLTVTFRHCLQIVNSVRTRRGSMRQIVKGLLVLLVLGVAASSHAQTLGTIAGVAKDATGAVLPGVSVEVSSPALIEKVRSATTDGAGAYAIISLPVGTYSVTFTLPGFSTIKRDGIEMVANFTATINAEMKVGAVAETVTVTGETPLVDVQGTITNRAVTPDLIKAIPNGGTMYQLAAMMPGVFITGGQDVGGSSGSPVGAQLSTHGGPGSDEVQMLDGMRVGNMMGGSRTQQTLSPLLYDEVDVQLAGQGGDAVSLGVTSNSIPRSGGNRFAGTIAGERLRSGAADEQSHRPAAGAPTDGHGDAAEALRRERIGRRSPRQGSSVVLRHRAVSDELDLRRRELFQRESAADVREPRTRSDHGSGVQPAVPVGQHRPVNGRRDVETAPERHRDRAAQVVAVFPGRDRCGLT